MKNKIQPIFFLLIATACAPTNSELPSPTLQNQEVIQKNSELRKENSKHKKELNRAQDYFSLSTQLVLSKDSLLKTAFNEVFQGDVYNDILPNVSTIVHPNRNQDYTLDLNNRHSNWFRFNAESFPSVYLHYLWQNFDRSPENIKTFLSPQNKAFLYSLFEATNVYESSGMQTILEALTIAHKELYLDPEKLEQLADHMDNQSVYSDATFYSLCSPEIDLLFEQRFTEDFDINSETRKVWLYSFWVRRYKEKNDKIVWQYLLEFKSHFDAIIQEREEDDGAEENDDTF